MYTAGGGWEALSLGERAYRTLKWSLLAGDFGLGERLGEERLAAQVGVSRTPVREGLMRLHAEGLVDRLPDGGYTPAVPDMPAIRELYEVRMTLELHALRRPEARGIERDRLMLARSRATWTFYRVSPPEPDPGFVMADERFHVDLAAASGNASLAAFLSMVNERIRVVRMHDFLTSERIDATIDEHLGILDAVLDGEIAVAEERLQAHLLGSMAVVEQRATAALERMASQNRTEV